MSNCFDTGAKVAYNFAKTIGKGDTMTLKGCWHVSKMERLMGNLYWDRKEGWGVCDLYPLGGRAEGWFYGRMGLSVENRVQFCCKGSIVAEGTIASEPRERTSQDPPIADSDFPSVVTITDVISLGTPKRCECYVRNPRFGSHRLRGRGPCS